MTVFITGIAGLLGGSTARYFAESGHRVVSALRTPNARSDRLVADHPRIGIVEGDLNRSSFYESLAGLNDEPIKTIIHFAGTSPAPGVGNDDMIADNVLATRRLLAFAEDVGVETFLFASAVSAHGQPNEDVIDESASIVNPDSYALTKLMAEALIRDRPGPMRRIVLRLPAVLGVGAGRHWLSRILALAKENRPIDVYNPDALFNNAVHVTDVTRFCADLIADGRDGHRLFTLGADGHLTIADLVGRVIARCGSSSAVTVVPPPRKSFTIDWSRSREAGYRPMALADMVDLYMDENEPESGGP